MFWGIARIVAIVFIGIAVSLVIWHRSIERWIVRRSSPSQGPEEDSVTTSAGIARWMTYGAAFGLGTAGVVLLTVSSAQ